MEKQWACKICSKTFSSGKAMGGHMRSHLAKLPLPLSQKSTYLVVPSFSTHPSSLLDYRSITSSFSDSDADSHSRLDRKRRSRRCRKIALDNEHNSDQVSSVSETFSDEEVAWCLLKLSRDIGEKENKVKIEEDDEEGDSVEERVDEEVSSEEEEDSVRRSKKRPANYKCDTCGKVFGSYQALGGHKASHKKMNIAKEEVDEVSNGGCENRESKLVVKNRAFQCPFCVKVFDSGQALGGHKKVHYSQMAITKVSSPSSPKLGLKLLDLDLNLFPAEFDDEQSKVQ